MEATAGKTFFEPGMSFGRDRKVGAVVPRAPLVPATRADIAERVLDARSLRAYRSLAGIWHIWRRADMTGDPAPLARQGRASE